MSASPRSTSRLQDIPLNLITGFLGVGKTSAILHLLEQKPASENWSVLVNEFGGIGIDGAIYASRGIQVRQVAGGCLCCSAGVPLQVAVNRILRETRPDRLLIEPSGIGHPRRVLDTLRSEHFQGVLDIRASLCLVDPRHLLDRRYRQHENFNDQIAMADILVANKMDLCDQRAEAAFDRFAGELHPPKMGIVKTEQGRIPVEALDRRTRGREGLAVSGQIDDGVAGGTGVDGYRSLSCRLSPAYCFRLDGLETLFRRWGDVRIKAILQTDRGWLIFNGAGDAISTSEAPPGGDNRLEVVGPEDAIAVLEREGLVDRLIAAADGYFSS